MSTGDVIGQYLGEAALPATRNTRPVRRSLFACVDTEESRRYINDEMTKIHQLDSQKWNFDFVNEVPLQAENVRYEWTAEMHSESECKDSNVSVVNDADENISCRQNNDLEKRENMACEKQSQITDFMRKRKCSNKQKETTALDEATTTRRSRT